MLWPKKMHTRNLMRKKIPAARTSFELYGERQRKRNCAINVYAALDQSAQEK